MLSAKAAYREPNTDQPSGHGILQVVVLCFETNDAGVDGEALGPPLRILCHNARPHLDLLPHP